MRLHGRSSQRGTRGFPGLTANPQHSWSLLECAAPWPLLAVWDPRFTRAHRQPQNLRDCTHNLKEKKKQKLENSTQLQQERAHTRYNEYTLTRPRATNTHDVFLRASSGAHAHLHEAFDLLVTPFILNSNPNVVFFAPFVFFFYPGCNFLFCPDYRLLISSRFRFFCPAAFFFVPTPTIDD